MTLVDQPPDLGGKLLTRFAPMPGILPVRPLTNAPIGIWFGLSIPFV
jgi:hypothetical protein